ncbi:peptidoglycan DD-metalloendopeptidase family protein [Halomonas sp. EGI 63088]|uniref:Peptidoglycan DD-metalloendopeptidase family protein n=1 Tax=Halomonas flagellata TaxID=2920385 RepID=A0ABS9RW40_9GAMM|nr:peptidoglycan DD-metalloendopeptidase family protein [Halomonas flagellata]MCH4564030.1 peptidoglycan DD-metalloendopeptidase family protein [Halomonas flagellata]
MLRILHSLPRTHKLLLLPVATMVTVLGAQKIVTSFQDVQRENQPLDTVLVPLDPDTQPGLPSLSFDRSPVAGAIEMASLALDATREHVPLSRLTASEVVEVDFVTAAESTENQRVPLALASVEHEAPEPADNAPVPGPMLDDGALHMAVVIGTLSSGMLDHDGTLVADATSYEEVSEEELILFGDGPVFLEEEIAASEPYVPEWETYTVQQGDTFAVMAQDHLGLGYSEVLGLLEALPDQNVLTRWRAGNSFEYQLDEEGKLLTLRVMRNARNGFFIERGEDGFEVATIERAGEATQRLFAGTVSGSFARSAQATGLSSSEVSQLSRLLEKKLDFRRDTRRGDRFQVLVESDIVDGQSLDSRVLAVQYDGARMDLTVVRNSTDSNFYTPEGESLDPAFNRYPFEGSYRLSSNFNPRRKHPVTGRISPHRGTDFAMPIGTPVQAPADGQVEKVGNHPLAGRYVVVRHDNGYRTRYLHLSRPLVSRGDRVSMGERIALSGNTGRSTGPHLHYEVIVNNNQVDAMKVDLPENQSLSGDALLAFQRDAEPLLAALQSGETGTVVARAQQPEASDDDDEG